MVYFFTAAVGFSLNLKLTLCPISHVIEGSVIPPPPTSPRLFFNNFVRVDLCFKILQLLVSTLFRLAYWLNNCDIAATKVLSRIY